MFAHYSCPSRRKATHIIHNYEPPAAAGTINRTNRDEHLGSSPGDSHIPRIKSATRSMQLPTTILCCKEHTVYKSWLPTTIRTHSSNLVGTFTILTLIKAVWILFPTHSNSLDMVFLVLTPTGKLGYVQLDISKPLTKVC